MAVIQTLYASFILLFIAGSDVTLRNCFGYVPGRRYTNGRWNRWTGYYTRSSSLTTELPSWRCKDGQSSIQHAQVCDGMIDCRDESDEVACNNSAPILYYYSYESGVHYNTSTVLTSSDCIAARNGAPTLFETFCRTIGEELLYLGSLDLGTNRVNHATVLNNTFQNFSNVSSIEQSRPWMYENISFTRRIQMATGGDQINFFYAANRTGVMKNYLKRGVMKNRFKDASESGTTPNNFTSPIVDWWTSNVFVIMNSELKFCDEDVRLCSKFLKSKHAKNPLMFTIAQKQRLLFWVKQLTDTQFFLLKYTLTAKSTTKNTSVIVVKNDLSKLPIGLTVDPITDRVYWMTKDNQSICFTSISFDGSKIETTRRDLLGSVHVTSFAVYNKTFYWTDVSDRRIWVCSMKDNCSYIDFVPDAFLPRSRYMEDRYVSDIGTLMIDYNASLANVITEKTCEAASCSHLCYPYSDGTYDCYCEETAISDSTTETKNGTLCNGKTLVVTYQNQLFTVGLLDVTTPPIIRQYTLNITNISTVAYDSFQGRVILTEVGQQNIYSWTPNTKELKLILTGDGPGTITSIAFDDTSNNLYWIDPTTSVLKIMNLQNRRKLNLVSGNSSYVLTDFALQTGQGTMALLFLKNNASMVVERLPMSGDLDRREFLYEDHEANDIGHLSIQYINSIFDERQLYLLDTQTNEIKFLSSDGGIQVVKAPNKSGMGRMQMVTFIDGSFVWTSEYDLIIRRAKTQGDFTPTNALNYLLRQQFSATLVITDVMQTIQLSGLATDANKTGILSIAPVSKSYNLDHGDVYTGMISSRCLHENGGCEELCVRTDSYRGFTCLCTEGKVLVHRNACISASEAETITENSREGFFTRPTAPTTTDLSKKIESAGTNMERTDSTHVNFLFPTFLGILCGFALGYFREDLLIKLQAARLQLVNYVPNRVQFTRMRTDENAANIL